MGRPPSLPVHVAGVEPSCTDVDLTRMVWESIASPRPSLGQARWNLSPPNCPLGVVKSKLNFQLVLSTLDLP
jgi:hypothetical protein